MKKIDFAVLNFLYNNATSGDYHDLQSLLEKEGYSVSGYEAEQVGKRLDSKGYIKLALSKTDASAIISSKGFEYIQDIKEKSKQLNLNNISSQERMETEKGIDELIRRINKLELGQEIIYDDLIKELQEVKELIGSLNKNKLSSLIVGTMVKYGLGKLADKVIEALPDASDILKLNT